MADFLAFSWTPYDSLSICYPYGDIGLEQHWLQLWPVAWRHQAITWSNVD